MGKKKLYKAQVGTEWVPVWAVSLDEALALAEEEYGADVVGRVKLEVAHEPR